MANRTQGPSLDKGESKKARCAYSARIHSSPRTSTSTGLRTNQTERHLGERYDELRPDAASSRGNPLAAVDGGPGLIEARESRRNDALPLTSPLAFCLATHRDSSFRASSFSFFGIGAVCRKRVAPEQASREKVADGHGRHKRGTPRKMRYTVAHCSRRRSCGRKSSLPSNWESSMAMGKK
ncbi:hypothetical protein MRX96_056117 [Rhipicephalus microplus]